jgi:L,D-transpeptidase catalytic domain
VSTGTRLCHQRHETPRPYPHNSRILSDESLAKRLQIMRALANEGWMGDAMKASKLSGMAIVASAVVALGTQALGQHAAVPVESQTKKRVIVVGLEERRLALVEDGQVKKVYTVAVGKPLTPSPVGTFSIERRVKNPTYQHDGKVVLPGPGNPVGTRWMGLSIKGYGIHGTNEPKSIGKAASHGCIRMAKADLEEMYEMVAVGDTVELIGERNEETAQLFGNGEKPVMARQSAEAAKTETAVATTAATAETLAVAGVAVAGTW